MDKTSRCPTIFVVLTCVTWVAQCRSFDFSWQYGFISGIPFPNGDFFANWGQKNISSGSNILPTRTQHKLLPDPDPAQPFVYFFGGRGLGVGDDLWNPPLPNQCMVDVWKFNTVTNIPTWIKGSLYSTASMSPETDLVLTGGLDNNLDPTNSPGARYDYAACASTDPSSRTLYVYGGRDKTGGVLRDFWLFDIPTNSWARIALYSTQTTGGGDPGPRANAAMIFIRSGAGSGNIYLMGGNTQYATSGTSADLWAFDIVTKIWTSKLVATAADTPASFTGTVMPAARLDHAMAYAGDNIFIFGGTAVSATGPLSFTYGSNDLWAFDLVSNTWTLLIGGTDPELMASAPNGAVIGQPSTTIMPCGRLSSVLSFLPSATALDPKTGGVGSKLILFGGSATRYGGTTVEVVFNDVWIFDIAARTWTWVNGEPAGADTAITHEIVGVGPIGNMSVNNIITARRGHGMAVTANPVLNPGVITAIYVYGGFGFAHNPDAGSGTLVTLADMWLFTLNAANPCDPMLATGCDMLSQCVCKANYTGFDCELCAQPGAIGWPNCHVCSNVTCAAGFGFNGVGGRECNETSSFAFCGNCSSGQFSPANDVLCHNCNCNTQGTVGNSPNCDNAGKCSCASTFAGDRCEYCAPGASGPNCIRFSSSAAPFSSSSLPFSSSSMSCSGQGGEDIRPRDIQLVFNLSSLQDGLFQVTPVVLAISELLQISQTQVNPGVSTISGGRVFFNIILRGDENNCKSAVNLTTLLLEFFTSNSSSSGGIIPNVEINSLPVVMVVCPGNKRTPDPPGICAIEHPKASDNTAAVAAGAAVGVFFCILCVLFLFWNHKKRQQEGISPVRMLIEKARGNRDKQPNIASPGHDLSTGSGMGTRSLQLMDGMGTASRKGDTSVLNDTNIGESLSVVSIIDNGVPRTAASASDLEFLSNFHSIRNVKDMDAYFNYLHNLKDRQLSLEIAARYLSPMQLLKPNSNFYLFCESDNLQRWVFPFLFKNHNSLVMSLSHSAEQNLLDLAMVLIVECHFNQFTGYRANQIQQPAYDGTKDTPLLIKTDQSLTVSVSNNVQPVQYSGVLHMGLQRTLEWLKTSNEWEWGAEASTFARLILFTFTHKLQTTWNARDMDQIGWKHLFPCLHTIENFVFCSPLTAVEENNNPVGPDEKPVVKEVGSKEREIGLHIDSNGFLDSFLIKETVKLLSHVLPVIQRNLVEPAPKEHLRIIEKTKIELEFFTAVAAYFTDAMAYVEENTTPTSREKLERIERDLVVSAENLGRIMSERVRHKKPEYTKREVKAVFAGNIESILRAREKIKKRAKLKAVHDYAADHLWDKEISEQKKRGDVSNNSSMDTSKIGVSSPKTRSPALLPISESGGNMSQMAGVFDNLNDRELAELKPYFTKEYLLGSGSFGSVYKAVFRGCDVAVKVIRPENARGKAAESFEKEIAMHLHLRSPRLLLPIRVWHKSPDLIMVTEIMARGNLRDVLRESDAEDEKDKGQSSPHHLTNQQRLQMAIQIAQGLMFLHRNDPPVVHRDIKPENVLVDEHYDVKLSDFGLSSTLTLLVVDNAATAVGSALYMAPELFAPMNKMPQAESSVLDSSSMGPSSSVASAKSEPAGDANATLTLLMRADVYSYGILLIELFGYSAPWHNFSMMQLVAAHMQGQTRAPPPDMIPFVKELVTQCIQPKAADRPDIGQVLATLMKVHNIKG